MSMSTHVIGFIPPDDMWKKMKIIWDTCRDTGVRVPKEVERFFNYEPPDDQGVQIKLDESVLRNFNDDMKDGYEVDVEQLVKKHPSVKIIRFFNSY